MSRFILQFCAVALFVFAGVTVCYAQPVDLQKCTICHGKPGHKRIDDSGHVQSLFVDEKILKGSVHAVRACTDCHADVTEIPHRVLPKKVNCTRCHYLGNPVGAPQDVDYQAYLKSVHGRAAANGKKDAPWCQDCHGNHNIKAHTNPGSNIFRDSIPKTCGRCHVDIYAQYRESVHGEALIAKGNQDVPVCTSCHGEHNILAPTDPGSTVYPSHVAEACSHCHAAETIMGKYGIESEQVATYDESFHGIAGKFGSATVANCASCHGVHDIRRPNDPKSSVYIDNIPKTCGRCHEGANINYAKGKIHVDAKKKEAGIVYYVAFAFKWLTILTMIGLIAHIMLDLNKKAKNSRQRKTGQPDA
ncbi:hypothetical protein HZA56_05405 [Candidatus Poribacteria bacterium]|nr:hypothetical protein [Candidatus Poribacteria bacterium]